MRPASHRWICGGLPRQPWKRRRKAEARPPSKSIRGLLVDLPADRGQTLRLCDFASAGATGTRYRSWLEAKDCPPPPVVTRLPRDGETIPPGSTLFRWTGPSRTNERVREYQLWIAGDPTFAEPLVKLSNLQSIGPADCEASEHLRAGP